AISSATRKETTFVVALRSQRMPPQSGERWPMTLKVIGPDGMLGKTVAPPTCPRSVAGQVKEQREPPAVEVAARLSYGFGLPNRRSLVRKQRRRRDVEAVRVNKQEPTHDAEHQEPLV